MMYELKTVVTMKEYNADKWWIDSGIVKDIDIEAGSVAEALRLYALEVADQAYIDISKNAIKTRRTMYRDTATGTRKIGYVLTGSADFQKESGAWVKQYIDLWVEVRKFDYEDEPAAYEPKTAEIKSFTIGNQEVA